jgi:hypothetical protein
MLTRPRYHGSFYITDIVQNESFGPSHRLVRTSDGRPLRHLVSGSRLRPQTAPHRVDFHVKYPELRGNIDQSLPTVILAARSYNRLIQVTELRLLMKEPPKSHKNLRTSPQ